MSLVSNSLLTRYTIEAGLPGFTFHYGEKEIQTALFARKGGRSEPIARSERHFQRKYWFVMCHLLSIVCHAPGQ